VSNANGRLHHLFERLGLFDAFDYIFDSHCEGVEKPDPRYFALALARSGAKAVDTLHVGDLYPQADCLRVRSLGELVSTLREQFV